MSGNEKESLPAMLAVSEPREPGGEDEEEEEDPGRIAKFMGSKARSPNPPLLMGGAWLSSRPASSDADDGPVVVVRLSSPANIQLPPRNIPKGSVLLGPGLLGNNSSSVLANSSCKQLPLSWARKDWLSLTGSGSELGV